MDSGRPDVIAATFGVAERRADHLARYFYAHLFWHHPEMRSLFPADMDEQHSRFVVTLGHIVQRRQDRELFAYLAALGRDHRKFGTYPKHYDAIGDSLVAALRFCCGSSWSPEAESAWTAAFRTVADAMIEASDAADWSGEPRWWSARIIQHRRHGADMAVLTAQLDRHLLYRAGQYITVQAPQASRVWRPYSLARAPRGNTLIELHVSRVAGGVLSNVLVSDISEGDLLRIGPARGLMTLPPIPLRPITFIAAGTGWAPIKALAEELVRRNTPRDAHIFVTARSPEHFYDRAAMRSLTGTHPSLRLTLLAPTPSQVPPQATQRLRAALIQQDDWRYRDIYLSGPPGFVTDIKDVLIACRAEPSRIFHDHQPPVVTVAASLYSPTEHLLTPRQPRWINPADR